jgi:putative addiction module killer protein
MAQEGPLEVLVYQTPAGRRPLHEWLEELRSDRRAFAAIQVRIDRLERGLTGDWKSIGKGIFELRVDFGPGYRIYFGRHGRFVVVLLCGGYKGTQRRDMSLARQFWSDYEKRTRGGSGTA